MGGGLYAGGGTLVIEHSTVAFNSASGGFGYHESGIGSSGGVYYGTRSQTHDAILAGNFADNDPDLSGNLGSLGYNLIGNSQGGSSFDATDLLNVNPRLGPLAHNGGPTKTHALWPGSPALNAGDPDALGLPDQRGVVRTGGVNIGAYQASATAFLLSAPDAVDPGVPFDVTVTAVDPFGQVAVGYTGTVTFSTSDADPGVVPPADYTFTPDDGGSHIFSDTGLGETTLLTPGDQTLTVLDTADDTLTGSALITVGGTAPGAGRYGLARQPQPSRPEGNTPQAGERPPSGVAAGDRWFAALDKWDFGFTWPPVRRARAGADGWAPDPWQGDEPLFP